MATVVMYSAHGCSYCQMAERLLRAKGADLEKIMVDREAGKREEMMARSNRRSVPQIFIGDVHVGGFEELALLEKQKKLDALLAA